MSSGVVLIDQTIDWYRQRIFWKMWKDKWVQVEEELFRIYRPSHVKQNYLYNSTSNRRFCDRDLGEMNHYLQFDDCNNTLNEFGLISKANLRLPFYNIYNMSGRKVGRIPKRYLYSNGSYLP